MGHRRFDDQRGHTWEIQDDGRDWVLYPVSGNPGAVQRVTPPRNERDPFEYSQLEIQKMLDDATPARRSPAKNPFID